MLFFYSRRSILRMNKTRLHLNAILAPCGCFGRLILMKICFLRSNPITERVLLLCFAGGGGGPDSPPEPAPSDLPMRHNGGLRPLKSSRYDGTADLDLDSEHSSGYHLQPNSGVYHPQGR